MPTRTALLDTNAVMELKGDEKAAAKSNGWRLTTTPWSFFERLCHLEDQADFARARGQLMQFRGIEIVDKPLDRLVAARQASDKPRIWGSHLSYAMLAAADAASSLDALYRSVIVDEAGQHRVIRDCADRIKGILDKEELRFQQLVTSIIKVLHSGQVAAASGSEQHQAILDMVASGESSFPDTPDLDYQNGATPGEMLALTYVYHAYTFLRGLAKGNAIGNTCAKNDFEDGQICAYVPLSQEIWVITGDGPLFETLSKTRSLLATVGMDKSAFFMPAGKDNLLQGGAS
mgnify:CR=1 FL=1